MFRCPAAFDRNKYAFAGRPNRRDKVSVLVSTPSPNPLADQDGYPDSVVFPHSGAESGKDELVQPRVGGRTHRFGPAEALSVFAEGSSEAGGMD